MVQKCRHTLCMARSLGVLLSQDIEGDKLCPIEIQTICLVSILEF
jgi:hypothetical protein